MGTDVQLPSVIVLIYRYRVTSSSLALKRLISFGSISGRKGGSLFFWGGIHRERVLEIRCMYALLARESVVISNLKSQFNTVHQRTSATQ